MAEPDHRLFRGGALQRFSSPDNLEQLMPVARAKDWVLIAVAGALLVLVGVWSVFGRVPTIAGGRGVILRPGHVKQAQAIATGRILSIPVRPGDQIKVGDLIATVDQAETLKRIDETRLALAMLKQQDVRQTAAETSQLALEAHQDTVERKGLEALRNTLQKSLDDAASLRPVLETRLNDIHAKVKDGTLKPFAQELYSAESARRDNDARMNDYSARLAQIDGQLEQIGSRGAALGKTILADSTARRNEMERVRQTIELDSSQVARNGNIRSAYAGRVAELVASAGQVISAGEEILTLDMDDAPGDSSRGAGLVSISYYPVREGKKIKPGMRIQITPDTVERARFGGIDGTVTSVSPMPVTREGAMATLGNAEIVKSLMPDGVYVEVQARLERDSTTPSGYKWSSSQGPDIQITSGLTHSTRVTIGQHAPVTYLLPILKETSGVF